MKIQISTSLIFFVVTISLFSGFAEAQEKDPFTRTTAKTETTGETSGRESMIAFSVEMVEVTEATLRSLESGGLNWNEWHRKVMSFVESGEATLIDSGIRLFRSGNRLKIESSLGLYYPIEEEVVESDPSGPLFPSVFDRNDVGFIIEADPVLGSGGDRVDVNVALEWSSYEGEDLAARKATERALETDVIKPIIREDKIVNQFELGIGDYQLMTQFSGRAKNTSTLVFVHYDLLAIPPLQDPGKLAASGDLSFRIHAVDVPLNHWHNWMSESDLSSLLDGGAWEKTSALLAEAEDTTLLYTTALETRSGTRSKVEMIEKMQFDTEFTAPASRGGNAKPAGREVFNTGLTWEIDPVMSNEGIIHINFALEINELCGYSVSYRKLDEGAWLPTVQYPKVFANRMTCQVLLHESMHLLAGVMTPPLADGSLDYSKKRLFFIHNETFASQ